MLHLNASRVAQLPFAGSSTGSEAMAIAIGKHAKMLEKEGFLPQLEG